MLAVVTSISCAILVPASLDSLKQLSPAIAVMMLELFQAVIIALFFRRLKMQVSKNGTA